MAVEGHTQVQLAGPAAVLGPARAPYRAGHERAALFRFQLAVAGGHHRDLRVGLLVARRYTVGDALGRGRGGVVAGVDDGGIEAAQGAVQLTDRWCTEALREGHAQQQFVGRLPAQADLAGAGAAEGGVIRVTAGNAQVQALAPEAFARQRHVEFHITFLHRIAADGHARGHAVVLAGDGDRIRMVFALVASPLGTGGEGQRPGPDVEQLAGDVGRAQ